MNKKFTDEELAQFSEASRVWAEVMQEVENQSETYWNSLTKEQQLQAFCAVSRRIYKGELEDQGTYRWVLYDVFGFGPEAYAPAQLAGYLSIHNAIFSADHEHRLLSKFAERLGLDPEAASLKAADFLA